MADSGYRKRTTLVPAYEDPKSSKSEVTAQIMKQAQEEQLSNILMKY